MPHRLRLASLMLHGYVQPSTWLGGIRDRRTLEVARELAGLGNTRRDTTMRDVRSPSHRDLPGFELSITVAALSVLAFHLVVIVFNVAGLVLIPLGAWRRWHWVQGFWWRLAHLLSLAVVAAQALAGSACFLTIWQADLSGGHAHVAPLIAGWIDRVIFWPLPLWVFAVLYVVVWLYVLALWWRVPPQPPWRRSHAPR